MTDPSHHENPPLTRREARRAARAADEPALPGSAARDIVGDPGAAEAAPGETDRPATLSEAAERSGSAGEAGPEPASSSLEDLFVPEEPPADGKRRRGRGCLVALLVLVVIAGGMTVAGYWAVNTYGERVAAFFGWDGPDDYEEGEATGEAIITIQEGDSGESISRTLYEAGVTLKPRSFYSHLLSRDAIPIFHPGVYRLQQRMTSEAALAALEDPANKLSNAVALQEGLTVDATLEAAATGLEMPLEELEAAAADPARYGVQADSLEGWLFPAYYTFDPGVTAEDVVRTMVERMRQALAEAGVPAGEEQRILTIASIVQREGVSAEDFRMVSRVIYNRLDPEISDTGGLLQMDSTAQYGYREEHGSVFSSAEQLSDPNPWNTYVHPGLPVGPIANPGDDAIVAALQPADGPWQYFVTVNLETGETVFSETYAEQERAEVRLREWCAANPDYSAC
ncbi:endolytic transglycosylase MltG [Microbacterium album]|uniref:Endolytic murein transglycosylase n=1 Tax=Microbacterium album TaxID=2053191 RepID=A0A917ICI0_9MICO|nr:endolytic transglycosylase MltG [Microbacterium album]GGH35689.1 ABC transporter substrate-binding protein [Microbacterium album]